MTNQAARITVVLRGLQEGKITKQEADTYLRATEHLTLDQARAQHERIPKITIIGLVIIAVLALGYFTTTTGFVVLDTTHADTLSNITSLRITGYLTGEGTANISLNTPSGTYHVATITSDDGSPRTEQPSYAHGDPVNVEHLPLGASVYFDDGITTITANLPLNATNGTLLIVTSTSTYRLPITIGNAPRTTIFTAVCDETCALSPTTGTIETTVDGNATLTITNITTTSSAPNRPPVLSRPFDTIALNTTMSIDLGSHFSDPDGDALLYTVGSNDDVNATITGSTLTITPLHNATSTLPVYASDLHELVPASIPLNITIPLNVPRETSNTTVSNLTNETAAGNRTDATGGSNVTVARNTTPENASPAFNTTIALNATNASIVTTTSDTALNVSNENDTVGSNVTCTGSNPNVLPTDCFLVNNTFYPGQDIYWENVDRSKVARFTALGNLLITGGVVEHDNATPEARDFTIGYLTPDDVYSATIWVDTTGNLHLRGSLHEENSNLAPPPGSYAVRNRRLLYLAYADPSTGDLFVRGNVIAYRRTIP